MAAISKQELEHASADAGTLEGFALGGVGVPNINRAGNDVKNLATIRQESLDVAADSARRQTYITYAQMLADTSQPIKTPARVETDPNAGDYVMTAGGWEWSDVQPVTRATVDPLFSGLAATDLRVDIAATAIKKVQNESLGLMRADLMNPLVSIFGHLYGDSKTWGSGASGRSSFNPRNGTLSDARNRIDAEISPSWANLFLRWLVGTFADTPLIQDAPGSGYGLATNQVDIFGLMAGFFEWKRGTDNSVMTPDQIRAGVIASGVSETEQYLDFYGALNTRPAEVSFETNAISLEIIYAVTASGDEESRRVKVYVDDVLTLNFTAWSSAAAFGRRQTLSLDGRKHKVRIRCEGSSFRMQGLTATRRIGVINDGINGSNTYSWLTKVPLSDAVKPFDTDAFVMLGANDRINYSEANFNTPYGFKRRLSQIVRDIRAATPGVRVTLLSSNAVTQAEGPGTDYQYGMRKIDTMIREVAEGLDCGFISQYALTLQAKYDGIDITPDGLHPGDITQRMMFENIRDRIMFS